MPLSQLDRFRLRIRAFAAERMWEQFHDPKNLVMALTGEVGELNEIFQWLTPEESKSAMRDPQRAEAVRDELADIFYYVLRLADVLDLELLEASEAKLTKNERRYPVAKSRGSTMKYTEFTPNPARRAGIARTRS